MISLTVTILLVGYASAACRQDWFAAGPHCYFVSHGDEGATWAGAEITCGIHGGSLATFQGTQSSISSTILQAIRHRHDNDKKVWIGATDQIGEGHWIWDPLEVSVTGSLGSIHDNKDDKNCLTIDPDHHFGLYADDCTSKNAYLCEIPNGNQQSTTSQPAIVG